MGRRRKQKGACDILSMMGSLCVLPITMAYGLANSMERDRKRRSKHSGIMSSGPRRNQRKW